MSAVGTRANFIMDHLRRTRHYGPVTYVVWIVVVSAIGTLTGASLWPHSIFAAHDGSLRLRTTETDDMRRVC